MKTGVIIQARLGSERLPEKVLKKFHWRGPTILEGIVHLSERCNVRKVVVATPDQVIKDYCKKLGVQCFVGDERDVMGRIIMAAEKFKIDVIVRVCADSPFILPWLINYGLSEYRKNPVDYFYTQDMPKGQNIEIMTLAALKRAYLRATSEEKEHVTLYFENHPIEFIYHPLSIELTVDTKEDYERLKNVARYY